LERGNVAFVLLVPTGRGIQTARQRSRWRVDAKREFADQIESALIARAKQFEGSIGWPVHLRAGLNEAIKIVHKARP